MMLFIPTDPEVAEAVAEAQALGRRRERRERIATTILAGMQANDHFTTGGATDVDRAGWAVAGADALIAELDKQP